MSCIFIIPQTTGTAQDESRKAVSEGVRTDRDCARTLRVTPAAVNQWHIVWKKRGLSGLKSKGHPGAETVLTKEKGQKLKRAILKGPRAFGYATDLWTLERIKTIAKHVEPILEYDPVKSEGAQPGNKVLAIPNKYAKVDLSMKKGSFLILHGNTLHGSYANISKDRLRPMILQVFINQGESFHRGQKGNRKEISLHD